ncbi:MAG: hypothetical protein ACK53Y_26070, partial [bacterium]
LLAARDQQPGHPVVGRSTDVRRRSTRGVFCAFEYMSIYSLGFDRFDRPVEGPPISGVSITHSAERAHRVRACRRDLFFVLGRRRLGADASLYRVRVLHWVHQTCPPIVPR